MNSAAAPSLPRPVAIAGTSPTILTQIFRPEVNLAIVERRLDEITSGYATFCCNREGRLNLRLVLPVTEVGGPLEQELPEHPDRHRLVDDIATVVEMFALLFDTAEVGLRLHKTDRTPCPAFHSDSVPCRLLLTYSGKGTQWLDEDNLDRRMVGARAQRENGRSACLDENRINSLGTGDIAIFKGEGSAGNEGLGLVHRSPPQAAGETRLVLTLDLPPGRRD